MPILWVSRSRPCGLRTVFFAPATHSLSKQKVNKRGLSANGASMDPFNIYPSIATKVATTIILRRRSHAEASRPL